MSTKKNRSKSAELFEAYENIIRLFSENEQGMNTKEVYQAMVEYYQFNKSERTIENYLKDILNGIVPGVKLTWVNRGRHQLKDHRNVSPDALQKHIEKIESKEVVYGEEKAYMRLAMESIRKMDTLSSKHHREIEKRLGISDIESPYFIDNEDMESIDMSDADIIHLKEAINKDALAEFRYIGKSRKERYLVEPYKLIIFDGLWYLFGKDRDDNTNPYKTWRLQHIKDVDYERDGSLTHNMSDEHSEAILKCADDAEFIVDSSQEPPSIQKNITVKVKVDPEILDSFNHNVHLPGDTQTPTKNKDGSITVTTKVNTINDVDAEIKSWFPHIEILEPISYREEFLMNICNYRGRFQEEIERIKAKHTVSK